jgi:hypothetical protein
VATLKERNSIVICGVSAVHQSPIQTQEGPSTFLRLKPTRGEKSIEQNRIRNLSGVVDLNRCGRRLQFRRILRQAAFGTLPVSRALSVENKYRYNCFLDWRTTKRKQSCAESEELLGQAMDEKLRRF